MMALQNRCRCSLPFAKEKEKKLFFQRGQIKNLWKPESVSAGGGRFKREDKSKKEDLFQFKMKKYCFSNAT
jgi:hypothetical protein